MGILNKPSNKHYFILREKCLRYCNTSTYNDLSGQLPETEGENPVIKLKGHLEKEHN